MNENADLSFLEGRVRGRVNGHLELGQNVFGNLDALLEGLTADHSDDLPVAQNRRLGQLQLAVEYALMQPRPLPLFYSVALAVLCVNIFSLEKYRSRVSFFF